MQLKKPIILVELPTRTNNVGDIVLNKDKTRLATINELTVDDPQECTNCVIVIYHEQPLDLSLNISNFFFIDISTKKIYEFTGNISHLQGRYNLDLSKCHLILGSSEEKMYEFGILSKAFIHYYISAYNNEIELSKKFSRAGTSENQIKTPPTKVFVEFEEENSGLINGYLVPKTNPDGTILLYVNDTCFD